MLLTLDEPANVVSERNAQTKCTLLIVFYNLRADGVVGGGYDMMTEKRAHMQVHCSNVEKLFVAVCQQLNLLVFCSEISARNCFGIFSACREPRTVSHLKCRAMAWQQRGNSRVCIENEQENDEHKFRDKFKWIITSLNHFSLNQACSASITKEIRLSHLVVNVKPPYESKWQKEQIKFGLENYN